jgi:hypothetical protein
MLIFVVFLLITACAGPQMPIEGEQFPDTCTSITGSSDLMGYEVSEYPCRKYKTDLSGNKR